MNKIKSIEKGWGENSIFFSTSKDTLLYHRVDEIKEENKQIGNNSCILVYVGYRGLKAVFEIEANASLTIIYYE